MRREGGGGREEDTRSEDVGKRLVYYGKEPYWCSYMITQDDNHCVYISLYKGKT